MNKTFNINLGSYPFAIDEDAYEYIQNYLDTIRRHFSALDGCEEILYDIEVRMAELFQEHLKGRAIISMKEIDEVIMIIGKPEDFGAEPMAETYQSSIRQTLHPASGDPVSTRYLQDPRYAYSQVFGQWRKEGAGATQLEATYAFADDLIAQTRYAGAAATTVYVQADGFGSVRWLTDAAGVVTDAVEYDAFGNDIGRQGVTPVEHLYRGEQFDSGLGFYYLRARWMDPGVGRSSQQDAFVGVDVGEGVEAVETDGCGVHCWGNPVVISPGTHGHSCQWPRR